MSKFLSSFLKDHHDAQCNSCFSVTRMEVVRLIDTMDAFDAWCDGENSCSSCGSCGAAIEVDVPVLANIPGIGKGKFIYYIPFALLDDPDILDFLMWEDGRMKVAYSKEEMQRVIEADIRVVRYFQSRRVSHRTIKIPPEIHSRIKGTYKKAKLKVIWYVSTHFEEGLTYSSQEVDDVLLKALSFLDSDGSGYGISHLRSALCELKLMARTSDGRRYWKCGNTAG